MENTESTEIPYAVLILAGGRSRRMGYDKLGLVYGGETLLERAARRFTAEFPHVYVSVRESGMQTAGLPPVIDIHPSLGPISGLHAALSKINCGGVFMVAADMPLAEPQNARRIIEMSQGFDICLAGSPEQPEPLFAFYTKSVLPAVERVIKSGDYSLARMFRTLNTRYVDISGETLTNVNTPEDYEDLLSNN